MKKVVFKKMGSSAPIGLYVIGIAALFMTGFLTLVVFGAQTYRDTVTSQTRNNHARAKLSYICAAVRAADAGGAVEVKEAVLDGGASTKVLSLADRDSGYAIRIYCYDGKLMEEYAKADAPLSPSSGSVVGETGSFEIETDGRLLRIRTDDGSVLLHLRSGAAPVQ